MATADDSSGVDRSDGDPATGGDRSDDGQRETLLRISDLSKRYEGVQALDEVSFDVHDNEVLALVGDNGAGKSTVIKTLSGVITPTGGTIYVRNEDGDLAERTIDDPNDAQAAGIETVFQELGLSGQHDVASNVFMGREPREDGLTGRLLRRIDREQMERRTVEALDEIGFQVDPNAPTAELSGGQQQATAVARALISDPRIVLLDEPTAEVSVEGSEKILELIENLKAQGRTVVFISHNLEEVFEVADRMVVLRDGKLVDVLVNDGSFDREHVVSLMTGALSPDTDHGASSAVAGEPDADAEATAE